MQKLFSTLLAGMLSCAIASSLAAQVSDARFVSPWRIDNALYLKPRLGVTSYSGDRSSLANSFSWLGPATGVELGYRRPAGPFNGGIGLSLLLGRYPTIADDATGLSSVAQSELNKWRHTLGITGYVELMPQARATPYLQVGVSTTAGVVDDRFRLALSPLAGAGVDIAITDQVGIFLEATGLFSFPDRQLDAAVEGGRGAFDWLGVYGGGIRIGLNKPFAPVEVLAVEGPTLLDAGESATYRAVTRSGATAPLTYRWRFSDGTEATGQQVSRAFAQPGNYSISVTARNQGSESTQRLAVTVSRLQPVVAEPRPDPAPPVAKRPVPESQQMPDAAVCATIAELNGVLFEKNVAVLSETGKAALAENLEVLERCPSLRVTLNVYVAPDEHAPEELAAQRARTVEQFYAQNGIAATRVTAIHLAPMPENVSRKGGLAHLRRVDTLPSRGLAVADRTAGVAAESSPRVLPPARE